MKNPVLLPSSKKNIERGVIEKHLLYFHCDPFDNTYLTIDMLMLNVELKTAIEKFIESKRLQELSTTKETMQKDRVPHNGAIILFYLLRIKLDVDRSLDKIPIEFLDSLELTLMKDPVILPSDVRVDLAVIRNHLSRFPVDPFSGSCLTEDVFYLFSDDDLKQRIEAFISSPQWRSMQSTTKETMQTGTPSSESSSGTQKGRMYSIDDILISDDNLKARIEKFLSCTNLGGRFGTATYQRPSKDFLIQQLMLRAAIQHYIESKEHNSREGSMQSTTNQTMQTGPASHQSCSGTQNDSDPRNTVRILLLYPQGGKLDIDVHPEDIPKEFLDPLESTLMVDPVVLPSGVRMDHSVILDYICKFHVDHSVEGILLKICLSYIVT
ncbi:hypothetical protein MKW92_014704 [Papaver armeniacum]|nr:hypothetical protein MKW92_014704 [Papaver armeniacum]